MGSPNVTQPASGSMDATDPHHLSLGSASFALHHSKEKQKIKELLVLVEWHFRPLLRWRRTCAGANVWQSLRYVLFCRMSWLDWNNDGCKAGANSVALLTPPPPLICYEARHNMGPPALHWAMEQEQPWVTCGEKNAPGLPASALPVLFPHPLSWDLRKILCL